MSKSKPSYFNNWLNQRLPKKRSHTFNTGNIFILPNRVALAVILATFAVYILGTNYANNLVLLLAYFVVSLIIVVMHFSFFNLSGLTIKCDNGKPIFLGEGLQLTLDVVSIRDIHNIGLFHQDGDYVWPNISKGRQNLTYTLKPAKRGWYQPGRLKIKSTAPVGWFNVWSKPDFAIHQLVYPKPIPCPQWMSGTGLSQYEQESNSKSQVQAEDFQGLRDYVETDSLKHVAWKQLAKGKGWLTKVFNENESQTLWFSYAKLGADSHEEALSMLTWLVVQAHKQNAHFGIELPNQLVGPGSGEPYIEECLQLLAEYP